MGETPRSAPSLAILLFVAGPTNFVIKVAPLILSRKESVKSFESALVLRTSSCSKAGLGTVTRRQLGLR